MIPRVLIQTVDVPGSRSKMSLHRQGDEHSIWLDGVPLMTSRLHGSEEALAGLGCQNLSDRPGARVLVGGLGMGFTLAAALRLVGPDAKVFVAELVPAVRDWNRDHLGHHAEHPLRDPRVEVAIVDVAVMVRNNPRGYDAILLDVDNGPSAMTLASNAGLYRPEGLALVAKALRPGGTVAFWSAYADAAFPKLLAKAGLRVDEHAVADRAGKKGSQHFVWTGSKG